MPFWGRSIVSRVFRDGAGPLGVRCSVMGQVHGESGVPHWQRSKVSIVFCDEVGPQ